MLQERRHLPRSYRQSGSTRPVFQGPILGTSNCRSLGVTHETTKSGFGRIAPIGAVMFLFALAAHGQQGQITNAAQSSEALPESKRILWVIPNYRTSPTLKDFEPLTAREKFKLATKDASDRGTFALAAMFGGQAQLTNANPSFGQGAAAFGRYFGTSFADFAIGDYMTEAVYPSLLRQDPRYFRRGTGGTWSRLRYAAGQIVLTHGDSGKKQLNFSELLGNSTAVAISCAYYPDNRTASDAISKLGVQLGVDMASNVLKEFWPELQRMLTRKRRDANWDR